ncbi:MAG: ATP-dependent Clp protease adapter ClpS [Treponema sp.]|jgi:ATP-dependent Clp protease adaptor protein ClpS|nr:ATP-dependent Clp protease adapter ClpS [Treponema sp.]
MPPGADGTELVRKKREKLTDPGDYRVILLNDNYTVMEFVVEVLMLIFHKAREDATRIMLDVHQKGKGTVGVYPYDIAQTKANQVHALARQYEFPLKCILERV